MRLMVESGWSKESYRAFRVLAGLYCAVHLALLVPWAAEVFSSSGMLPDAGLSPLIHAFPNVLALADGSAFVTIFVASGAAAAVLLALGIHDRIAALYVWYVLACIFGRNPLIQNPSLPYVGMVLLAHASIGRDRKPSNAVSSTVFWLMGLGYFYSGLTKLDSPSWLDGTAVRFILQNPLARPTFVRDAFLAMPDALLALATWGVLALELSFPLLALSRRARPWAWALMAALHLSLCVLIDFTDLSAGMLLLHAFTFDPRWATGARARWHAACCALRRAFPMASPDTQFAFRPANRDRTLGAGARARPRIDDRARAGRSPSG